MSDKQQSVSWAQVVAALIATTPEAITPTAEMVATLTDEKKKEGK